MDELASFPERRLSAVEVEAIESSASSQSVVDTQPQFVLVDDDTGERSVVGVTMVFASGNVVIACFDPTEGVWKRAMTEDAEDIEVIEEQLDDVFEWMDEKYGEEGYATVGSLPGA